MDGINAATEAVLTRPIIEGISTKEGSFGFFPPHGYEEKT